jgi:3-oxoacyl-(acyl-carrier-protein) synthase
MKLIAHASIEASQLNFDALDPAYRRATTNMAMATLACEQALSTIPAQIPREEVSFVLGTHFGEVHSTLDFLSTYYETNTPRPILFQNSLHNSTLGFATIKLGLTGPALTVITDRKTQNSVLNLAESLLTMTPYVMVCFVDCIPDQLIPQYLENFPFMEKFMNKAHCFVFSKDNADIEKIAAPAGWF